jgi:holo-[acyl-carrier protein] synthase
MNIGIDIVEVRRIAKLIRNKAFLKRVFTSEEIRYCSQKKNKAQHFAVRFATKEAVWKAVRRKSLALKDIGVKNLPDGKPTVFIKDKPIRNIEVSLSHTNDHAVAVAIVKNNRDK